MQASALVGTVPDLNLDVYSLKRQEAAFESLLRAVSEVLLKHVEPDAVAHCARALVHCTQHGPHAIQVNIMCVVLYLTDLLRIQPRVGKTVSRNTASGIMDSMLLLAY